MNTTTSNNNSRRSARSVLPRLLTRIIVPLAGYAVLRPFVGSDAEALVIAGSVPAAWTLGILVARRRIDPLGLLGTAGFGVSLLLLWFSGGSAVAVKLGEPVVTGLIGVAFLLSVVVGKPLYGMIMRMTRRPVGAYAKPFTLIIGAILVVHTAVVVALAIALPTTEYLAVGRPVGWAVIAVGLGGLLWYRKRAVSSTSDGSDSGLPQGIART